MSRHSNTTTNTVIREFRKASYSQNSNHCVEVADCTCHSSMGDTQNRHLGALDFVRPEWQAFVALVRQ